ncbi:hypothetical protein ACJJI3_15935 [Microbulbifer sp. ZKSA004]|uniref:hypothetical protein n=1 Tax=Microbulbifer sp. ZKSA004 TaxID=3243389 RepID=UPI00403A177E
MVLLSKLIQYHEEFRTAIFVSGFTIGSFLFSMKSFILKTMKDDFYDSEDYQEKISQARKLGSDVGFYTPLKNFSRLLLCAIVLSFLSALSQISIGYISNPWAVIFCLILAFISWVLVAIAIYYVGENWSSAIDLAEKKAVKKDSSS